MEEAPELGFEGRKQRDEERQREEVAVEEVFVPVRPVDGVGELGIEAHDCGEDLGKQEDGEASNERGINFRGSGRGFALQKRLVWADAW